MRRRVCLDNWLTETVLRGVCRALGDTLGPRLAINPSILQQFFNNLDFRVPLDLCFRTSCVIPFFSFLSVKSVAYYWHFHVSPVVIFALRLHYCYSLDSCMMPQCSVLLFIYPSGGNYLVMDYKCFLV